MNSLPSRPSRKRVIGGLVAAGVLTVGIAAPAVAFADAGTAPKPSPSTSSDSGSTPHGQDGRGADPRDRFAEELATELGVPQDKVEAALAKIRQQHQAERQDRGQDKPDGKSKADREARLKTRLDKAVSDGKLTREQADAIIAAFQAGVLPAWGGGGPGHGGGWGARGGWKHDDPNHNGRPGGPANTGQTDTPTTS